ncbi:MAG: hypothetical protein ACJAQT_004491 [Akkermansiaceae bacterium]|jgi:hypothetical protein
MKKGIRFVIFKIAWFASCFCSDATETSDKVDQILTAQKDDLPGLRSRHRKDPNLSFLILDQWARLAPSSALQQDLTSDEEETVWLLWGRHHGKKALSLHHESTTPDDIAKPSLLQGYAESAPDEVISLITNNPKYQAFQENTKVGMGIVRGLALSEPIRAVEFIAIHFPQNLKGYPSENMTDKALRSAIWRWLCFEPEHALNWMLTKKDPPLIPDLLGVLAIQIPQKIREAHSDLPTGLMKKTFNEGLILAESKDENVLELSIMASAEEITTSHTFKNLVDLAKLTEWTTFPGWLSNQRLEHLDKQKEILIRTIIKERWAKINPEALVRFQHSRGNFDWKEGLTGWLQKSRKSATHFVHTRGEPKSWALRHAIHQLIGSLGRLDAEEALALYQRYEKKDLLDDVNYDDVFLEIAEKDREAFLRFALANKAHRQPNEESYSSGWNNFPPKPAQRHWRPGSISKNKGSNQSKQRIFSSLITFSKIS